jgi:hypothetical protein
LKNTLLNAGLTARKTKAPKEIAEWSFLDPPAIGFEGHDIN